MDIDIDLSEKSKLPGLIKFLVIVAAVIAAFFMGIRLYFRLPVRDYYNKSRRAFQIPGLKDDYVAQGITYDDISDMFFMTGYIKGEEEGSPIYVVSRADGTLKKTVSMADENGLPLALHAGGLSVHGDYIYVAGGTEHCLYVFDKNDVLNADNNGSVLCKGRYSTAVSDSDHVDIAFTTVSDGKLYVGEFFREQNYPTLPSHKLRTPCGDDNTAIVVAIPFSTEEDGMFGLASAPSEAYSIRGLVQGMCFKDGKVYLSTSYALAFSHISVYEDKLDSGRTINVLGTEVPLYFLDSSNLIKEYKIPPMSEEIEFVGDEMFTQCESASSKYIFGKFTGGKWCYATKFEDETK